MCPRAVTTLREAHRSLLRSNLLAMLLLALFAGCSSQAPRPPVREAQAVLFRAIGLVGTPYQWGGNSPETGFDCSGLVRFVYRDAAGMLLPRTSRAMSRLDAPQIDREQLAGGDLLFFHGSGNAISHVAIYVGNGEFVHSPNSGGSVRTDRLDGPYWSEHFAFALRPLAR